MLSKPEIALLLPLKRVTLDGAGASFPYSRSAIYSALLLFESLAQSGLSRVYYIDNYD
jgi:hypothetical protein